MCVFQELARRELKRKYIGIEKSKEFFDKFQKICIAKMTNPDVNDNDMHSTYSLNDDPQN